MSRTTAALDPGRAGPLSPAGRRIITALLFVLAIGTPIAFARAFLIDFDRPGNPVDAFTDANTYLAAGERLDAGHDLYRLQPGDREVFIVPDLFTVPFTSPPPIAVLWRPIAAVPFGLAVWVAACWVALLGTVVYLVLRIGPPAAFLAILLALPIGHQLAVANVTSFFPAIFVVAWRYRTSAWPGVPLGVITAVKLAPIGMAGWLIAERRFRTLAAMAATIGAIGVVSLLGAGMDAHLRYLEIAPTLRPTPYSVPGLTGIPWSAYAVLVGGIVIAALLHRRPRLAFAVSVVAVTFGTPVLYLAGLVVLLALGAPLLPQPGIATRDADGPAPTAQEALGV